MPTMDAKRLKALESRLGVKLPPAFVATLREQAPIHEGQVALVAPDRVWDVRTTFRLDDGHPDDQLDRVYDLVEDVLPAGALPIAEDWGGNFYCLMLTGTHAGQVVYWDHERDEGDDKVEPVADTITSFYERLVPDPRE
ncbi:MAG TPA: SMI1/KNR4 family protein [Planctomycetaceae bacterium]|nr:SMI1/KNR4 family protein [Planctomycetaceae bacterium]